MRLIKFKQYMPSGIKYSGMDKDGFTSPDSNFGINPLYQYTGLSDKDGVDSYVNDIIKTKHGQIMIIRFGICPDSGVTCFYLENTKEDFTTYKFSDKHRFEIIGNTTQNPELLDKK